MAGPAHTSRRSARAAPVAWLAVALVAVAFVALSWSRISAPFADSDEGINGAVWGYGSRSLRELGAAESRLGGVRIDGTRYATHPPLIVLEAATAETLAGEHPWTTRAPAWIGTLVALALLFALLRTTGAGDAAAAGGVIVAGASGMVLTYGSMLDTPVTGLPLGLGVLLVWSRRWARWEDAEDAPDPAGPAAVAGTAGLTALACLASWQCAVLAGVLVVIWCTRVRRGGVRAVLREAAPYALGALVGVALSVGWSWWAHDGLGVLWGKWTRRTGAAAPSSLADVVTFQVPWLGQLLGVGLLGWLGALLALRDRRWRAVAAVSVTVVVLQGALFKEAAAGHQYWLYWSVLPTAVGAAYLLALLSRKLRSDGIVGARGAGVAVLALAAAVAVVDLSLLPRDALRLIDDGQRPLELVQAASPLPAGQDHLLYVGEEYRPDDWLRYARLPAARHLGRADEVVELARSHPDWAVLVLGSCPAPPDPVCAAVTRDAPDVPRMITVADAAAALG